MRVLSILILCCALLIACTLFQTTNAQCQKKHDKSGYCSIGYDLPLNVTVSDNEKSIETYWVLRSYGKPLSENCRNEYKKGQCASFYPKCTEDQPYGLPICASQCEKIRIACENDDIKVTDLRCGSDDSECVVTDVSASVRCTFSITFFVILLVTIINNFAL